MPPTHLLLLLLAFKQAAGLLVPHKWPLVLRNPALVLSISDAKETLVKELRYSHSLSPAALDAFEELAAEPLDVSWDGQPPWVGRFNLIGHDALAAALQGLRAPLELAKVIIAPDGVLTAELDLFVGGAVVGLRLHGSVCAEEQGDRLRLRLQSFEWFEPSAEFGVSRQIALARDKLDATLSTLPYEASLALCFAQDGLCVLRHTAAANSPVVIQSVRGSREADAAMAAVLARAAAGPRGSVAFDEKGQYLGDS
jgi:hypothetical protein